MVNALKSLGGKNKKIFFFKGIEFGFMSNKTGNQGNVLFGHVVVFHHSPGYYYFLSSLGSFSALLLLLQKRGLVYCQEAWIVCRRCHVFEEEVWRSRCCFLLRRDGPS